MRPARPVVPGRPVWGIILLAALLVAGGVDVHGASLNPSTYETPHPVFHVCGDASQPEHLEPAGSTLVPAHEPVLRSRWLVLAIEPPARHHAALDTRAVRTALEDVSLPRSVGSPARAPRGPPAL